MEIEIDKVKAKYVECKNYGCGFTLPIGYTSIRGYCASCEHLAYQRRNSEALYAQQKLKNIHNDTFQFKDK